MRKNGKRIQSSKKDFEVRAKSYSEPISGLNEILTNGYFVNGTTNLDTIFFKFNGKKCFAIRNNGEFFTKQKMENALSYYGCESANTAGNENGTGLKTFASYFTSGNPESFFIIVSKSKYGEYSYGLISSEGEVYLNEDDLDDNDKLFIEHIKAEYLSTIEEGTITSIYNSAHTDEISASEIERTINDMFTTGLTKVKCTIDDNGRVREVDYVDRTYENIDDENIKRIKFDTSFTYKNKQGKEKTFLTTVFAVDTHYIENHRELYNKYDELNDGVIHSYGFTAGYDNGYTPMYKSSVVLLGFKGRQQYYHTYSGMIAHPVENNENYASIRDWQEFYSDFGRVNAQKVPNYSTPFNFYWNGKLKSAYESFYNAVIEPIRNKFNEWMPEEDKKSLEKEIFNEEINNIVHEKMHFMTCDTTYIFNLRNFNDDDVFVKYEIDDDGNHLISFNLNHKDISKYFNGKSEDMIKALSGYFKSFKAITYGEKSCGDTESKIKIFCRQLNKLED